MKKTILGFVQAPNYVADKQQVKAPVKQYVPYVYKCTGDYAIGPNGFIIEKDSNLDNDKPNASWE
jgi:hypothetical protein